MFLAVNAIDIYVIIMPVLPLNVILICLIITIHTNGAVEKS